MYERDKTVNTKRVELVKCPEQASWIEPMKERMKPCSMCTVCSRDYVRALSDPFPLNMKAWNWVEPDTWTLGLLRRMSSDLWLCRSRMVCSGLVWIAWTSWSRPIRDIAACLEYLTDFPAVSKLRYDRTLGKANSFASRRVACLRPRIIQRAAGGTAHRFESRQRQITTARIKAQAGDQLEFDHAVDLLAHTLLYRHVQTSIYWSRLKAWAANARAVWSFG